MERPDPRRHHAGEYTQLTGRAGRRGIDVDGHAVVLSGPACSQRLAGLASTRTYPLRSSFRPTYNMAVNLVRRVGRRIARELLETSFAQYQSDQSVVGLAATIKRNENVIAGYEESMHCHLGTSASTQRSVRSCPRWKISSRGSARLTRSHAAQSLESWLPETWSRCPRDAGPDSPSSLTPGSTTSENPRPQVLTIDRQVRRLSVTDFPTPAVVVDRLRLTTSIPAAPMPAKPWPHDCANSPGVTPT